LGQLIIQIGSPLLEHLQINQTPPEFLSTSTFISHLFDFLFEKDHSDILLISFLNNHVCSFIMNVYSDSSHLALKYLKDTEVNINNLLIMTRDFNIRDSLWNLSFPHHSSISDNLIIIADSFNLDLSILTNSIPTRYSDTKGEANLVIDLMFFHSGSNKLNNHLIHPDWYFSSNHAPLTISIPIAEENIISFRLLIPKNSKEEATFVKEATVIIKNLNTSNLTDHNKLEDIVNLLESKIKQV